MKSPIGICSAKIVAAGNELQLFPAGEFRAVDGRPAEVSAWRMDAVIAKAVIDQFNGRKNPMVVDYEHQSMLTKANGRPAPAAGWINGLEWREGKGLYATGVKWTDLAACSIKADEYRFVSPVFTYNKSDGRIEKLINAALVNNPALDGMDEVVALSFGAQESESELAMLKLEFARRDVDQVIQTALSDTRLLPWQREAAYTLASVDLKALKTLLDRPRFLPKMMQSEALGMAMQSTRSTAVASLTQADLHMCKLSGRTPEEFAALKLQFEADSGITTGEQ